MRVDKFTTMKSVPPPLFSCTMESEISLSPAEIFSYLLAIISLAVTVIFAIKGDLERRATKALIQSEYNSHYVIARACSVAKEVISSKTKEEDAGYAVFQIMRSLEKIEGVVDSSRGKLIAHGKHFFPKDKIPKYEHPAFPDEDQSKEVMLGMTPDEYIKENNK